MNLRIVYALLIVTSAIACGGKPEAVVLSEKKFVPVDTIEIPTGFVPSSVYSGFLQVGDSAYLYLANLKVHDSLHFYTYPELKKRKTVPLNTIIDREYELYNIQVASLDSIMLMGRYHNILFTVDDKGEIINERDLNPLADKDSFRVDLDLLRGDNQNIFTFDGKPYLLLNAANASIKPYPSGSVADAIRFFGSRFTDQSLALYSFTDNTLRFDSLALFRPLNPDGKLITIHGFYGYARFGSNILLTSRYTDTLYVIEPERLTIKAKILLQFSGGALGIEPVAVTKENLPNESQLSEENARKTNYAYCVFADCRHTYAFVGVVNKERTEDKDKPHPPISFIVLDSTLRQVDEETFDNRHLNMGIIIPVNNGFLFSLDTPDNPDFDERKARFALYRYE